MHKCLLMLIMLKILTKLTKIHAEDISCIFLFSLVKYEHHSVSFSFCRVYQSSFFLVYYVN